MFALTTLDMIPFLERWVHTDINDWNSIQTFLTDSRSLLDNHCYLSNPDAKKLKLIERIMYVSAEIKENEDEVGGKVIDLHECMNTIIFKNTTQHPKVIKEWEEFNSRNANYHMNPSLEDLLKFALLYCEGLVSMENVIKQIEAAMTEQQKFRHGIDTGVGRAIKADEHADKLRTGIIEIGFDTMRTISKPVPGTGYKVRTATGKPVSAGLHENITKSIHAALIKLG
ncbi:hypothetical protein T484DRAFT_1758625 [Baffinella frigidus]|nr:hypothetical protein T484DRAFT_1758625 [Cryptophyta sp. CCMP2293]